MKNLSVLVSQCIIELHDMNIEIGNILRVEINTRAKKRWGQCKIIHNSSVWENKIFTINISERLLSDNVPDCATKSTIIHELLHTCKDCMDHGEEWQRLAQKVNQKHPEYNIKRTASAAEKGITEIKSPEPKYILKCESCGREIHYTRMTDVVKYPFLYRCGKCKGELERIK